MSAIIRNPSNVISAGDISLQAVGGDILLKTQTGTVRVTIPNSGAPAIEIDGDCDLTTGHQYTVNGVPIGGGLTFVDHEVPGGSHDGFNKVFTLAFAPVASTVYVYINGQLATLGADYTLTGITFQTLTFTDAPSLADVYEVSYRY